MYRAEQAAGRLIYVLMTNKMTESRRKVICMILRFFLYVIIPSVMPRRDIFLEGDVEALLAQHCSTEFVGETPIPLPDVWAKRSFVIGY